MQNTIREILIIEDDDLFFCALKNRLLKKDIQVLRARDGREGINMAKRGKYSLVVADVVLPHHNGFDIIKTLRSDYGIRHKFIILSNLGQSTLLEDREFLNSLGVIKYLIKSNHSITDIARQITECVDEKYQ